MHAKPEKVRVRRLKRQLKAAISIGVALAAGVFLACQKTAAEKIEDARSADDGFRPSADEAGGDKSVIDVTLVDAAGTTPGIISPPPDAETTSALAPLPSDAGGKADALAKRPVPAKDAGKVDKREHRKGMPVPDNLLE